MGLRKSLIEIIILLSIAAKLSQILCPISGQGTGEVCDLTGLRPHVLRYWESQFRFLSPPKNRSGNRVYQRREVDLIMLVKHLLYTEKYTIEGARQKVDEHKKSQDLKRIRRSLDLA